MPSPEQIAELDAIIAELKTHPEKHKQNQWISFEGLDNEPPKQFLPTLECGSAFCLAGAAVIRAGAQPSTWIENEYSDGWIMINCMTKDGEQREIGSYAQELLGLTSADAHRLFYAWNTIEDIETIRNDIVSGNYTNIY